MTNYQGPHHVALNGGSDCPVTSALGARQDIISHPESFRSMSVRSINFRVRVRKQESHARQFSGLERVILLQEKPILCPASS